MKLSGRFNKAKSNVQSRVSQSNLLEFLFLWSGTSWLPLVFTISHNLWTALLQIKSALISMTSSAKYLPWTIVSSSYVQTEILLKPRFLLNMAGKKMKKIAGSGSQDITQQKQSNCRFTEPSYIMIALLLQIEIKLMLDEKADSHGFMEARTTILTMHPQCRLQYLAPQKGRRKEINYRGGKSSLQWKMINYWYVVFRKYRMKLSI